MPAPCPLHDGLQREVERVDRERRENESTLFGKFEALNQRLSNMEGRIIGYVLTGSVLAGVLGLLGQWFMQHATKGGTP